MILKRIIQNKAIQLKINKNELGYTHCNSLCRICCDDLVSNDYYQKELKFQQQIDRTQESQKLVEQPQAKIENGAVKIKFPEVIGKEHLTGNINFYRPNDSSKDLAFTVQTDSTGSQSIPTTKMQKGIYNLQLTWEASGKNYYNELSIYVP